MMYGPPRFADFTADWKARSISVVRGSLTSLGLSSMSASTITSTFAYTNQDHQLKNPSMDGKLPITEPAAPVLR